MSHSAVFDGSYRAAEDAAPCVMGRFKHSGVESFHVERVFAHHVGLEPSDRFRDHRPRVARSFAVADNALIGFDFYEYPRCADISLAQYGCDFGDSHEMSPPSRVALVVMLEPFADGEFADVSSSECRRVVRLDWSYLVRCGFDT